jgi:hypothetical protein
LDLIIGKRPLLNTVQRRHHVARAFSLNGGAQESEIEAIRKAMQRAPAGYPSTPLGRLWCRVSEALQHVARALIVTCSGGAMRFAFKCSVARGSRGMPRIDGA